MRDVFESPRQDEPGPMPSFRLHGRHVLAGFVAFFAIVFAVNGYMLVAALRTHSGVVAVEPYRKGLAYNARIAAGERQAALGWTDTITAERSGRVRVVLLDDQGSAPTAVALTGSIGRPTTSYGSHTLTFRTIGNGLYETDVPPLEAGAWIVDIEARHVGGASEEPAYRARRRLWLQR
ncbi:MAG: FixH family protein [Hyphomicrobiaceae bacterium]